MLCFLLHNLALQNAFIEPSIILRLSFVSFAYCTSPFYFSQRCFLSVDVIIIIQDVRLWPYTVFLTQVYWLPISQLQEGGLSYQSDGVIQTHFARNQKLLCSRELLEFICSLRGRKQHLAFFSGVKSYMYKMTFQTENPQVPWTES